jgi:hypothetical protein
MEICEPTAKRTQRFPSPTIHLLLANPQITTTVPAVNAVAEVDEDLAAAGAPPLDEKGMSLLQAYAAAQARDGLAMLSKDPQWAAIIP